MSTFDWDQMWEDFQLWFSACEAAAAHNRCTECGGRSNHTSPSWEEQQDKIEELVEAEVVRDD